MKYDALKSFLASRKQERLRLSFDEVARIARIKLPASAYDHAAWWANDSKSHVQAKAWLEAGYRTENVDLVAQCVEFVRTESRRHGMREMRQNEFQHQVSAPVKVHPAYGALKGTFTIHNWDVTKPALDADEYALWEANLLRKMDEISKGLRSKK
jgi:hypothetical protein